MAEQRDTILLRIHRRRLATWGIAEGPADVPIIRPTAYESALLDRAERVLDGQDYAIPHAHQQREMGMCIECDAAAIIDEYRNPDRA